jgi:hypothetical protein
MRCGGLGVAHDFGEVNRGDLDRLKDTAQTVGEFIPVMVFGSARWSGLLLAMSEYAISKVKNAFDRIAKYVQETRSPLPVAPQHSRVLRAPSRVQNGETAEAIAAPPGMKSPRFRLPSATSPPEMHRFTMRVFWVRVHGARHRVTCDSIALKRSRT